MKKILSVLLVFILVLGMMSGCAKSDGTTPVIHVGDEVITDGEMKYAISVVRESMISGKEGQALEDFWNTLIDGVDPEDYIRENAMSLLVDMSLMAQAAKENGVDVTDEEVDAYFAENQESLAGVMEQYNVDETTLKAVYRKQMLYNKFGETVLAQDERFTPSDEVLKEYFVSNFYKAQHILKLTVDSQTNAPLSQEDRDLARAEIDAVLAAVKGGADFEEMMLAHTEDPGVEQSPEGYVFAEGEMVPEFYEGTVALPENGISEVIESSYGYHIIKRLPLDVDADFEVNKYKVQSVFVYAAEEELLEELKTNVKISQDDAKIKAIPVK